ncbi:DUF6586 family protein [Pseudomonas lopnurensis]|uniref:DUF6586 family protein n=1 Tax=Pseudomonas lopnurensis TaxID=1477517 RepID=UPI0018796D42|nr:DUF6586 family protein [Pseudomonas lopnurensis]MBE7376998.1 PasA protein [Pseudomonas lopnurensis]
MAYELYTRTNQKIFFAGLSLDGWRKAEEAASLNSQGLIQAEREACLFHLYGALLGLCHEIAGYYRTPGADARAVEAFLARGMLEAAPSPELAELVELSEQPDTWLSRLLGAYGALFAAPRPPAKAKSDPRQPLIEAVSLEEDIPPLPRAELEAWRQNLKGLALRFRESLTEW